MLPALFRFSLFSSEERGLKKKMLGGCQRLKLQPHLASCDWALITCRVKFHQWIRGKEGATEDGRTRKSDKGGKRREDCLRRNPAHFCAF